MTGKELLNEIASEIVVCQKCELWKTRKNAVPGDGDIEKRIMFIGEAPGYWEDVKGRPFVGAAGKLLDELLSEIGLLREDVFVGNVLKCRPPDNREPSPQEVETCTPYLDRQINVIHPKVIVSLGNHSTSYLFSKYRLPFGGITKAHGKFYDVSTLDAHLSIFPTFHPAAGLYHGRYKELLHKDFQMLKSHL